MRSTFSTPLKFIGAAILAFALWSLARPLYEPLLTRTAGALLSLTERAAVTELHYERGAVRIFRAGLRGESGGTIQPAYITFNLILLVTLALAFVRRPLGRWAARFALAILALFLVHVAATWVAAKTLIVMTAAAQNRIEIGWWENILFAAYQGYSVIGGAALAFAIWWIALRGDQGSAQPEQHRS